MIRFHVPRQRGPRGRARRLRRHGDLAHRKLYPALASLAAGDQLPGRLAVIGVARREGDDENFAEQVRKSVADAGGDAEAMPDRGVHFRNVHGSVDDSSTFDALRHVIEDCDARHHTQGNRLYYLATVPSTFRRSPPDWQHRFGQRAARLVFPIVVEKPFGRDLASAEELNDELHKCFHEHQIFRIDHYLAKETVQNIMALRFTNTIFEPIWNRRYIDHVQITVAEDLGVEHRGNFYEQSGRDSRHRPEPSSAGTDCSGDGTASRRSTPITRSRREGEGIAFDPAPRPRARSAATSCGGQYARQVRSTGRRFPATASRKV